MSEGIGRWMDGSTSTDTGAADEDQQAMADTSTSIATLRAIIKEHLQKKKKNKNDRLFSSILNKQSSNRQKMEVHARGGKLEVSFDSEPFDGREMDVIRMDIGGKEETEEQWKRAFEEWMDKYRV